MYWWIRKRTLLALTGVCALLLMCYSCAEDLASSSGDRPHYADLPAFFGAEVERLSQEQPNVRKTVSAGDGSEQQEMVIDNWSRELSSFLDIDLNKPAYRDDISKDSSAHVVTYRVDNPDLDIVSVAITYDEGKPVAIDIVRHIQNFLYNTQERLRYNKYEGYVIEKKQNVWILGDNQYHIEGRFIR